MNVHLSSVRHPESNELLERANDIIRLGVTKSLFGLEKGKWPEELIKVVWNHNYSISRSTKFTPFKLLFGDEAMSLEDVKLGLARTIASNDNEDNVKISKDAIEESKLEVIEHIRKYQAKLVKWQNRKVKLKNIEPDHLVLQRVANPDTTGKLQRSGKALT
jgi:DNA polymerase III delta prime subunit